MTLSSASEALTATPTSGTFVISGSGEDSPDTEAAPVGGPGLGGTAGEEGGDVIRESDPDAGAFGRVEPAF